MFSFSPIFSNSVARRLISALVIAALLVGTLGHAVPAHAQEYTYAECSRADAATLRAEVETIALGVLARSGDAIDVQPIVDHAWNTMGLALTFDAAVAGAVTRVSNEKGYWDKFVSGWSSSHAETLAADVAAYAFEDAAFQAKMNELSGAVAAELAREIETMSAASASSALLCLQAYVGQSYSDKLFTLFQREIATTLAAAPIGLPAAAVTLSPVDTHLKGITGIGIILAAQITRQVAQALAKKIAGRLVGKIAGRIAGRLGSSVIPYVGWVIGLGLIVWDLVEGAQGALPQIQETLQSEEVKAEVRAEIAKAIDAGLTEQLQEMAGTLATTLTGEWDGFCARNSGLCALTRENSTFRSILDTTPLDQVAALAALAQTFLEVEPLGRSALDEALDTGTFEALLALPASALELLAATASPATVLAWSTLAGMALDQVVAFEVYSYVTPEQVTGAELAAFLATGDAALVRKLLLLDGETRAVLATLPGDALAFLAANQSEADLVWLAGYLTEMPDIEQGDAAQIAAQVASGATTVELLRNPPRVESPIAAVVGSPNEVAVPAPAQNGTAPEQPVGLWALMPFNGVLAASVILFFCIVVAGVILAGREQPSEPG